MGEQLVKKAFPNATIVRPAVMYGHEDRFLNVIGMLSSLPFGIPVARGGQHLLSPVSVSDVAEGIVKSIRSEKSVGRSVDFAGPSAYRMTDIIDLVGRVLFRDLKHVSLSPLATQLYTAGFSLLDWKRPMFATDQLKAWSEDEKPQPGANLTPIDIGMSHLRTLEESSLELLRVFRNPGDIREPGLLSKPNKSL